MLKRDKNRVERELYLARLYIRPTRHEGWRLTVLETLNFNTSRSWAFVAVEWSKVSGLKISFSYVI